MSDLIRRQDAIDVHCEMCPYKYTCCPVLSGNICPEFEVFRLLPSVKVERVSATWVKTEIGWKCSNCTLCTNIKGKTEFNYCPKCGAIMVGESDD